MKEAKPDFEPPLGYGWLLERRLVGYEPCGPLQPWHFEPIENQVDISARWKRPFNGDSLVTFARRQDCDDVACFRISNSRVVSVCLVHLWTNDGYEVMEEYATFWEWLKSIVDDIAAWAEMPE